MTNSRLTFIKLAIFASILFMAYYITSLFGLDDWCNILSPINAIFAAVVLLYSYLLSDRKNPVNIALLMLVLACFVWFVADIFWVVSFYQGEDPSSSIMITSIYSLTNLFFGAAILIYLFCQFNKWHTLQLLLDTTAVVLSSILLIWIAFFNKDISYLSLLITKDGILFGISLFLDFLIIIGVIMNLFFVRKGHSPTNVIILGAGLFIFALTDVYFYYSYMNNLYLPNSVTDVIFVGALLTIALGVLWGGLAQPTRGVGKMNEAQLNRKWLILVLFLLAAILFEGIVYTDLVIFVFIIAVYHTLSSQVRLAIRNGELYHKELELNRILEKRVQEQFKELTYLANHDTMTKLHNRRFFINSLDEAMKSLLADEVLAIFMTDINQFKMINDTFGHDAGDQVLVTISDRMLALNKYNPFLARLGGDEFALYIRGKYTRDDLEEICQQFIESCSIPVSIDQHVVIVTISVGISVFPKDADDRSSVMRNADLAMYHAKSLGYNKYIFFDSLFNEESEYVIKKSI